MSTTFSNLLSCTAGGSDFQLEDYTLRNEPIIQPNIGQVGSDIRVDGTGWIEGTDAADYNSKLIAAQAALRSAGQLFQITEISGQVSVNLAPLVCLDGGPHVGFELMPQMEDAALRRRFRFTVVARTGILALNGYRQTVATGPDGLRTITRSSEGTQASASSYFTSVIQPGFRSLYPAPDFVLQHVEYNFDQSNLALSYSMTVKELAGPLPSTDCVDGECRLRTTRDEQMRKVSVFDFDLLLGTDNYEEVLDLIRGQVAEMGEIRDESVDVTIVQQVRVVAALSILSGGDGSALMDWKQRFSLMDSEQTWQQITYPGADPILVAMPFNLPKLVQSGEAIGAAAWIEEPSPLYADRLSENPVVNYSMNSNFEFVTEWTYTMIIDDDSFRIDGARLAGLKRPATPIIIS